MVKCEAIYTLFILTLPLQQEVCFWNIEPLLNFLGTQVLYCKLLFKVCLHLCVYVIFDTSILLSLHSIYFKTTVCPPVVTLYTGHFVQHPLPSLYRQIFLFIMHLFLRVVSLTLICQGLIPFFRTHLLVLFSTFFLLILVSPPPA